MFPYVCMFSFERKLLIVSSSSSRNDSIRITIFRNAFDMKLSNLIRKISVHNNIPQKPFWDATIRVKQDSQCIIADTIDSRIWIYVSRSFDLFSCKSEI